MKNMWVTIIFGILGFVVLIGLVFGGMIVSTGNTVVRLDNQVQTAKANINKEQERRVSLFNNLVDSIKSYNKYEGDTLTKVTKERVGDIDKEKLTLNAVAEKYPDLKSQKNYQNTMIEFAATENRVADYIETYNNDVRSYNNYVQTFPHNWFVGISGHAVQHYDQSNYKVDNNAAKNLFD